MRVKLLRLLVLTVLPACGHGSAHAGDEWKRWFDQTVGRLTRWEAFSLPMPDGTTVHTPDGLSLRLVHSFKKRNDYGCWDTGTDKWPGPGWRDVCVSRVVPEMEVGSGFRLRPEPPDPEVADQHQAEKWEVGVVTIDGRRAIVERARVSGGIEGARRERRTAILIELRPSGWAHLAGRTGDDAGYAELLGIAGTIQSQ
jgi:hypothetical protein